MAARPALLKYFFSVASTALLSFSFGVSATVRAPRTSPPTADAVQTEPLSEVNFYRLVQRVRQRQTTTEAAIQELRQRGIAFEVTDEVLARARQLGAPNDLLTALIELDLQRAEPSPPTVRPRPTGGIPSGTLPEASRPTTTAPTEASALSNDAPLDGDIEQRLRQLPLIEQARFYALQSADDLPDFLVTQTIRRMTRDSDGRWRLRDVLETEVRVEGGRERVELLSINGRPTNQRFEEIGGATSIGDFSGQLAAPFLPATNTRFTEVKQERYRGRLCRVYDFTVPQANSGYTLTVRLSDGRPQRIQVGYQGSLWVDEETKRIVRIEHTATDIPPGFPMSQVESAVDYDWVTILGRRYWMPRTAETIQVSDAYRQAFRNISEFRNYRKFEGDIKIID
ncbi:MAG: hypothetical protein NZ585_08995 [Chloracidobacterium sp.]|nr:hypothetical protein [Chloracidobacterium sp.]MDW8217441.1 hypothetical protein [Acidobacteriota bacterium]